MTASKIFFDTTPIIYFLDDDIHYADKVEQIINSFMAQKTKFTTSALSCTEYLIYPFKTNNVEKIDAFHSFLNDLKFSIYDIDVITGEKAASLKAKYDGFKTVDSLQLASAILNACDLFFTNDRQLRRCEEIKVVTVDDFFPKN